MFYEHFCFFSYTVKHVLVKLNFYYLEVFPAMFYYYFLWSQDATQKKKNYRVWLYFFYMFYIYMFSIAFYPLITSCGYLGILFFFTEFWSFSSSYSSPFFFIIIIKSNFGLRIIFDNSVGYHDLFVIRYMFGELISLETKGICETTKRSSHKVSFRIGIVYVSKLTSQRSHCNHKQILLSFRTKAQLLVLWDSFKPLSLKNLSPRITRIRSLGISLSTEILSQINLLKPFWYWKIFLKEQ